MADERKSGGDQPRQEADRAGESSQVDRIRDIIVGDKVQALEDRLIRVDRSLDREVEALRDEVRRLRSDLTGLIRGEVDSVKAEFGRAKTETEQHVATKMEELDGQLQNWLSAKVVSIENNVIARQDEILSFRESSQDRLADLGQALEVIRQGQAALGDKLRELEDVLAGLKLDNDGLASTATAQADELARTKAGLETLETGLAEARNWLEGGLSQGLEGLRAELAVQDGKLEELGRTQSGLLDSLEDLAGKHLAGLAEMRQRMVRHLAFYHPNTRPGSGTGKPRPPRTVKATPEAEEKNSEN